MSLRNLRLNKGLTLEETAKYLGITKQGYWNYEKGIRKIPLEVAVKLSKLFNVTTEEIFLYSNSNQNVNKAI